LSQERVDAVLRGYDRFNRGEIDAALEGFAPDVVWIVPDILPDPGPFHGPDGVRRFWEMWRDTFSDFRIEVSKAFDLDDHVVVQAAVRGVGRDSGAEVTTPAFPSVWTWRGEKIVRMEMFQSTSAAQAAIGKVWT
jgi:ketosteroid isomerase-like protein